MNLCWDTDSLGDKRWMLVMKLQYLPYKLGKKHVKSRR